MQCSNLAWSRIMKRRRLVRWWAESLLSLQQQQKCTSEAGCLSQASSSKERSAEQIVALRHCNSALEKIVVQFLTSAKQPPSQSQSRSAGYSLSHRCEAWGRPINIEWWNMAGWREVSTQIVSNREKNLRGVFPTSREIKMATWEKQFAVAALFEAQPWAMRHLILGPTCSPKKSVHRLVLADLAIRTPYPIIVNDGRNTASEANYGTSIESRRKVRLLAARDCKVTFSSLTFKITDLIASTDSGVQPQNRLCSWKIWSKIAL